MRMNNSYNTSGRYEVDRWIGTFADCTYNIVSMEGDRGKDRVRQFRLSTAFLQDGPSVNVLPL